MSTSIKKQECRLNMDHIRKPLRWFVKQDETTMLVIMNRMSAELDTVRIRNARYGEKAEDEIYQALFALLNSIKCCGYSDEIAFTKSKGISCTAAKAISTRRQSRAREHQSHKQKVQSWIGQNMGKIAELRNANFSWRRISIVIEAEYGLKMSHNTLYKHWKDAHATRRKNIFINIKSS